jgi:WD40 repeat protein
VIGLHGPELPAFDRLPYPVALTTRRLTEAVRSGGDPLKVLFSLKDCFEATIKYLGIVLLTEYFSSRACTPEHSEALLERMVKPSLGDWVSTVVRDLSEWLAGNGGNLGQQVAGFFVRVPQGRSAKPQPTDLWKRCSQFVEYRNDALGHGATRRDAVYRGDIERWLPLLQQLLGAVANLSAWRLLLVNDRDRCQVWMGHEPATATEPGQFRQEQIGHFVLRGRMTGERPGGGPDIRDLYPFICYVPDARLQQRLHYYDSIYRYQETRKDVRVLEYDEGQRQVTPEPVAGLEERFTRELLARAIGRHRSRMEVIEGRVANFGELLAAHADIVGRRFAIEHVKRFIEEHDRGLLLIEAEPGKGKTALLCHLIENEFGHYSPPPVHFFYRRTAGITDPDVCVKSLYASLLEAHGIEESEESQRQDSPEAVYHKLVNLLGQSIAPRLAPSRPQLILIDALDEAEAAPSGPTAYQQIPENLPAGVYVIATARPVRDKALLARRSHLECYDLDSPDLLQENLRDGRDYVERELAASHLPTETLGEIARVGRGNFLVLKHLCGHVRSHLNPDEVGTFLGRLATDPAANRLGFIYEESWSRMVQRATLDEQQCLGDVAGLLVAARTAVPAELICHALDLRAAAWDLTLRRLIEYLTVTHYDEDGASETVYRIYHESFADFLRSKLATDRDRYERLLADYCLRWAELPAGYARLYALRFGPAHLMAARQWDAVETLLTDLEFLEAKTEAGLIFDLTADLTAAVRLLPEDRPRRRILKLLEEALRRDIHFIHRHAKDYPQGLFQCLWNTCWWYDCEEAGAQHVEPKGGWSPKKAPWLQLADQKLCRLLERWRDMRLQTSPRLPWVRTHRPPSVTLGTGQRAVFCGHAGSVNCVAYSPNGRRIVSGSSDGRAIVWDSESGAPLTVLCELEGFVNGVRYSPDGRRIVSGSWDGSIRVWDAESGVELLVLRGHDGSVNSVCYSADGRFIASSGDTTIRLWDAESGAEKGVFRGHGEGARSVTYSPDGQRIASAGSWDKTVRVWDVESGAELAVLRGHESAVNSVSYSADSRFVASGSADKTIRVWDANSGVQLATMRGHEGSIGGVAYSGDGRRIVSGSDDSTVRVWDVESGVVLAVLRGHEGPVRSVSYSQDGRFVASGSWDKTVRVWDSESGGEPAVMREHGGIVTSIAYSPDGRRIAVAGSWDYTVRVQDTESGDELTVLDGHKGDITRVSYTSDGGRITTHSLDGTFRVWDAGSGAELTVLRGHKGHSVTCSPNGRWIACGSWDGKIRLWDAETGDKLRVLRGHEGSHQGSVDSLEYSPDGQRLTSGSIDGTIRVWDPERGVELAVFRGHEGNVANVTYTPDGRRIVSESLDGTIRVWDAQTGECLEIIEGSGDVKAIAAGASKFPLRAIARVHETVIERTEDGKPIAWFPIVLAHIITHPSGRTWAGAVANHLCLITFEGITEPASQEDIKTP